MVSEGFHSQATLSGDQVRFCSPVADMLRGRVRDFLSEQIPGVQQLVEPAKIGAKANHDVLN